MDALEHYHAAEGLLARAEQANRATTLAEQAQVHATLAQVGVQAIAEADRSGAWDGRTTLAHLAKEASS